MEIFRQCLEQMRMRSVLRDAEYWEVELKEGETPIVEKCNEYTLCLRTTEGFILELLYGILDMKFTVYVKLPEGFHHDPLNTRGIFWDVASLYYDGHEHEYNWSYSSICDADFSRPLEGQYRDAFASGPVQVLNTCRLFIEELMAKKHQGPEETFRKNLRWMRENSIIRDQKYWDLKLTDGEIPTTLSRLHYHLPIKTKEGFLIRIGYLNMDCQSFFGEVEFPSHLYLTSMLQNTKYSALNIYVPDLNVDANHSEGNAYRWKYNNPRYAKMSLPLASQLDAETSDGFKRVIGPVQLLEEARRIIKSVMAVESEILAKKKREMMDVLAEELMIKACHPKRIAEWVEQEFDPFSG